jgi:hypothetical protein
MLQSTLASRGHCTVPKCRCSEFTGENSDGTPCFVSSGFFVQFGRFINLIIHCIKQIPRSPADLCVCDHAWISHLLLVEDDTAAPHYSMMRGGMSDGSCGGFQPVRFEWLSTIILTYISFSREVNGAYVLPASVVCSGLLMQSLDVPLSLVQCK